jgi:hypothetical protein
MILTPTATSLNQHQRQRLAQPHHGTVLSLAHHSAELLPLPLPLLLRLLCGVMGISWLTYSSGANAWPVRSLLLAHTISSKEAAAWACLPAAAACLACLGCLAQQAQPRHLGGAAVSGRCQRQAQHVCAHPEGLHSPAGLVIQ